jgi:hypothetical protein
MSKITPKLKKKIKALAAAWAVIESTKFTPGERKAVREALEVYHGCGDWEDHFDGDDYMDMLKKGRKGWDESTDAELAFEVDAYAVIENLKERDEAEFGLMIDRGECGIN